MFENHKYLIKGLLLIIGVIFVAVGLELFLVPNNIIDGGIVGISIILSHLTKQSLGIFVFLLNIPFMIFGYKKLGKNFVVTSLLAISLLSVTLQYFHHMPKATDDLLLACIFGGVIIGLGLGLIFRNNGSLDGTEVVALSISEKKPFTVGEIIMFFNIFILLSAGLVFGWDKAMYSLIAYYIIFKTIDVVIDGLDESKSVNIISASPKDIAKAIMQKLDIGVTYIQGKGGYTEEPREIVYCVVSRLELANLREIVKEVDSNAFIAIENVHEVQGGRFNRKFDF